MLQAYVDETGTHGGSVCALVGFISTAEKWQKFSDEWAAECLEQPQTPDFHMVNAWTPYGSYWGFRPNKELTKPELVARRDTRLIALVEIIKRSVLMGIRASLRHDVYDAIVKGKVDRRIDSPYFFLFWHLQLSVAHWLTVNRPDEKVQFVFDNYGKVGAEAGSWYKDMIQGVPASASPILARTPSFEDDKDALPLKAADMYAWCFQRLKNDQEKVASRLQEVLSPRLVELIEHFNEVGGIGTEMQPKTLSILVDLMNKNNYYPSQ